MLFNWYLYEDVACYGEVGFVYNAEFLDEFLCHTYEVFIQQYSEDFSVSREKFQSSNTI